MPSRTVSIDSGKKKKSDNVSNYSSRGVVLVNVEFYNLPKSDLLWSPKNPAGACVFSQKNVITNVPHFLIICVIFCVIFVCFSIIDICA